MPVIAASRPDGLGTRLLTILHARAWSDYTNDKLVVFWESLADVNYSENGVLLQADDYQDIFSSDSVFTDRADIQVVPYNSFATASKVHLSQIFGRLSSMTKEEFFSIYNNCEVFIYDLPFPISFVDDLGTSAFNRNAKYWDAIGFADDVVEAARTLTSLSDGDSGYTAVHFRRGDMLNALSRSSLSHLQNVGITQVFQRYLPVATAISTISSKLSSTRRILVCSEDREISQRFQSLLGEEFHVASSEIFPHGGNKAALLDLLILANSSSLVTPFKSFFSECAVSIGKCQAYNPGLDCVNIVKELDSYLESTGAAEMAQRKAILYSCGYMNMWHMPDDPFRSWLLSSAFASDHDIAGQMTGLSSLSGK
ncbi:hypothetical protein C8J34_1094 [Rhizobium sp. PP-F2F-G36]|nr:hypothetical protein C8J34_1094 [Rhizobium sp. PP-F2F-G36]